MMKRCRYLTNLFIASGGREHVSIMLKTNPSEYCLKGYQPSVADFAPGLAIEIETTITSGDKGNLPGYLKSP